MSKPLENQDRSARSLRSRMKKKQRPLDARTLALVNGADAILKLKARIAELDHRRKGPDSETQGSES